jgi:hypothetical protein
VRLHPTPKESQKVKRFSRRVERREPERGRRRQLRIEQRTRSSRAPTELAVAEHWRDDRRHQMTAMTELLRELAGAENIVGPRDERHPLCAASRRGDVRRARARLATRVPCTATPLALISRSRSRTLLLSTEPIPLRSPGGDPLFSKREVGSTRPLPWNFSGNRSQPTATDSACLGGFRADLICH